MWQKRGWPHHWDSHILLKAFLLWKKVLFIHLPAGLLACYEPKIRGLNPANPEKAHLKAAMERYKHMLTSLLQDYVISSNDWSHVLSTPKLWTSFMVQAYGAFIEVLVFYKMPNFLCLFVMCLSDLHVLIRLKSLYLFLERENLVRALRDSDCQNFKNNQKSAIKKYILITIGKFFWQKYLQNQFNNIIGFDKVWCSVFEGNVASWQLSQEQK